MKTLGTLSIPATPMVCDNSWGSRNLGSHASSMTLYAIGRGCSIEWHIPTLDRIEIINLVFEHKELIDYDGVFCLPQQAIELIRQCGFVVPKEFD